jgi:hypothetical protein
MVGLLWIGLLISLALCVWQSEHEGIDALCAAALSAILLLALLLTLVALWSVWWSHGPSPHKGRLLLALAVDLSAGIALSRRDFPSWPVQ